MKPVILISAGGTGGHIFPALAVAKALQDQYTIIWVGATSGLENQIVPQHGFTLERVAIGGIRNKGFIRKLSLPYTLIKASLCCLSIIIKYKPRVVIGFGGYATFPICLMAKFTARKVLIHEQNSVAGLTNKMLAKISDRVLTAFPDVLVSSKAELVGNPVRNEIIQVGNKRNYDRVKEKPNLLIIGGSLGAKALNDNVPLAIAGNNFGNIVHQVGRGDIKPVEELYKANGINAKVVNFIDNMAEAYADADLIICRAGASTVAEVASAGIAAIFIPYPYAVDDHQTTNAKYLAQNQAAILLPQEKLTPETLKSTLDGLPHEKIIEMGRIAHGLAISNATTRICDNIVRLLN